MPGIIGGIGGWGGPHFGFAARLVAKLYDTEE